MKTVFFYRVKRNETILILDLVNIIENRMMVKFTNYGVALETTQKMISGMCSKNGKLKLADIVITDCYLINFYSKKGANHFFTNCDETFSYHDYKEFDNKYIILVTKKNDKEYENFKNLLDILSLYFETNYAYLFDMESEKIPEVVSNGIATPELSYGEVTYTTSFAYRRHVINPQYIPMLMPIMYFKNYTAQEVKSWGIKTCEDYNGGVIIEANKNLEIDDKYEKDKTYKILEKKGLIKVIKETIK